jgi:hypothetical protein
MQQLHELTESRVDETNARLKVAEANIEIK